MLVASLVPVVCDVDCGCGWLLGQTWLLCCFLGYSC